MKLLTILLIMLAIVPAAFASMERTFSSTTVSRGEQVTITYHETGGQSYSIIQDIPNGWSASGLSQDGKFRAFVDSGADYQLTVTSPSYDVTSNFGGSYFIYPVTTWTPFSSTSVTVGVGGSSPSSNGKMSGLTWLWIGGGALAAYFIFKNK